jgi:hypothetical protein
VSAWRELSDSTTVPLATGERLYARWQFQDYISTRAVQIVQVQHTCLPYYTLMQQWSDSFPVGYRVLRIYPDELQTAGGWNESLWLVWLVIVMGGQPDLIQAGGIWCARLDL